MTLQQLKYVSMVERCGSFSKAAQKLYVSQPSVSNLVHGLEEELHITIFQRTPSGVVITNEGRELLKLGNKLLRSRPHAFMSHSHPLAQRASVTPEELMDYPCIVYEQSADSPAFYSEEMLLPNFYPPRVVYISDLYVSTALMRSCNAYDIGTGVISPRLAREVACVAIDTADTVDIGWIGIRGKALRRLCRELCLQPHHQPQPGLSGAEAGGAGARCRRRGLKTLGVRMRQYNESALKVARWLEADPRIEIVRYPMLESNPQYDIARRQMKGGSGMLSFDVKGGLEAGKRFINSLKLCTLAVSLGDTETLVERAAPQGPPHPPPCCFLSLQ